MAASALIVAAAAFLLSACSDSPLEVRNALEGAGEFRIAPDSSSIDVGDTLRLSIEGPGNPGNLVWSTTSDGVAGVDPTGLVHGKRDGKTVIFATNGRWSDSALVMVGEGPEAGDHARSGPPAGYRILSDNPFEKLAKGAWSTAWNDRGHLRIVRDRSAPKSCCTVAEFFYPRGFEAGRAPAVAQVPLNGVRGVYVSMWWKASRNFEGHPSGVNKLLFLFPNMGDGWYLTWYGTGSLRVNPQGHPNATWLTSNVDDRGLRDDTWYHIELLVEHRRGDRWDVKWWVDGTLRARHTNVGWADRDLSVLKLSPTWGGMGGRKAREDYFRWDHVHVSVLR